MKLKIYMLVLCCALFWHTNEIDAQTARCDFTYKNNRFDYTSENTNYKCKLDTRQANFNEKITRIDGQHETGHTDDDVKFITIYEDNKLKTFSSILCRKFSNVKEIKMSYAKLETIDEDSLMNCKNLEHLDLSGNMIRKFPEYLLIGNPKLSKINTYNNQLTTLPANLFLNQKELNELQLGSNQINFLPSNIFHPLVKLEKLKLPHNKLPSINPEWFANLHNLLELELNDNQISEVPSKAFTSLGNLKHLFLGENAISDLPSNVFTPLKSLKSLLLDENKLTTIHSDSFGVHNELKFLYLGRNKINAIDEKVIDSAAVSNLDMTKNICSQFNNWLSSPKPTNEIKQNLKKCFDNYQPRIQPSNSNAANSCGKSITGQGNIIGGTQITRGSFPWIAALILTTGDYFCGGSLVTNRKVVTAAHCMQEKHSATPKSAGEFAALLGGHDIKRFIEVGRVPYAVQKINIHRDWNPLTEPYDADIAVLVLDREVIFNEHIQPICLPNTYVAALRTGVIVGYGKSEDETKVHENIPKILNIPIHTNEKCFLDHYVLSRLSSRRTFCGGTGTGIGVCRGDSGGGLFVTNEKVFYLRGIVSSSLIDGRYGCDVDAYSVFTDVTKYTDWIDGISTNRFD